MSTNLNKVTRAKIEDYIYNNPLALTVIENPEIIRYVNRFLPFSTGFEIECNAIDNPKLWQFEAIPNIMHVEINYEHKFRIPNGIAGLVCLYNISEACKDNLLLNKSSGIHYHIDCTLFFKYITKEIINNNKEWILEELDSWEYTGDYNNRDIRFGKGSQWINVRPNFKTLEFRIGEMTFDYELLVRRITHANEIVRELVTKIREADSTIKPFKIEYCSFNPKAVQEYIIKLEKDLKEQIDKTSYDQRNIKEVFEQDENAIMDVINNRVLRI